MCRSRRTEVAGTESVQEIYDENGDRDHILLKDISVTYISGGFQTKVTSDIRIDAPTLPYTTMTSVQTSAPSFAIIAKGLLQQNGGAGTVYVNGGVYAGGLTVDGSGNTLNVKSTEDFVVNGPVEVNGGILSFGAGSNLWAKNIRLDAAGSVTLTGNTYVENDLNLAGKETQAVLSGWYFGYGDGYKDVIHETDKPPDPEYSSAILINGKYTLLDMSNLNALMLAGSAYVDYQGGDNSTVLTGESIAVKSNQIAYLLPESCLVSGVSNPYEFKDNPDNTKLASDCIKLDPALQKYGITDPVQNIQYIRKSIGTTNLVYFCMEFPTADDAKAYFSDYFEANKEIVQKYMDIYSNGIVLKSDATKILTGTGFTFDDATDVASPVVGGSVVPPKSISGAKENCANLRVTLSRINDVYDGADNAFDYFVDESQLPGGIQSYTSGSATAVVTSGDYNYTGDDSIHLIIAGGSVTVSGSFKGLIFAGGNVTLNGSVTTDSALVSEALKALVVKSGDLGDLNVYQYLNPKHISPVNSSDNLDGSSIWNMSALVSYENWAKNKDES